MSELINNADIKNKILNFENVLLSLEESQKIQLHITHFHANGIYAREMKMPKGIVLTGAIHKYDHICVLNIGKICVVDEFEGSRILEAPCTFVSKAGVKRAFEALEDSVFTTFHKCIETEESKIWDALVSKNYEEYAKFMENEAHKQLGGIK